LARIWYGKIPVRDYPNSPEFERRFLEIMCRFVEDHGGNRNDVAELIRQRREEFEAVHGREIVFKDRICKFWWMVRSGIPKALYDAFANEEIIEGILWTAEWLLDYEKEEKEPPYEPAPWMEPLDYYEQLPVFDLEPVWRLLANELLRDLARVWHGKTKVLPKDFHERLRELPMAFAIDKGYTQREFQEKVWEAEVDFEEIHGRGPFFSTPIQRVIWVAKAGLPEPQATEFLNDPQVKFILTSAELIYALSKTGLKPPYEKYSVSFGPLAEYESLPVLTRERAS